MREGRQRYGLGQGGSFGYRGAPRIVFSFDQEVGSATQGASYTGCRAPQRDAHLRACDTLSSISEVSRPPSGLSWPSLFRVAFRTTPPSPYSPMPGEPSSSAGSRPCMRIRNLERRGTKCARGSVRRRAPGGDASAHRSTGSRVRPDRGIRPVRRAIGRTRGGIPDGRLRCDRALASSGSVIVR